MEGKSIAVSLLLLSLVVVGEAKSCCQSTTARNIYNTCRLAGGSRPTCASLSGCKIVDGKCPPGYDKTTLGDAVTEYCNLGCSVSVCGPITTLQNSGEVAVEKCNNACSSFCTKRVITAEVETA